MQYYNGHTTTYQADIYDIRFLSHVIITSVTHNDSNTFPKCNKERYIFSLTLTWSVKHRCLWPKFIEFGSLSKVLYRKCNFSAVFINSDYLWKSLYADVRKQIKKTWPHEEYLFVFVWRKCKSSNYTLWYF